MSDPELAVLASSWWIALLFFAWGIAEATIQPIVPDVGLGFLALATPAALGQPLAAAIAGGVLGAVLLAELRRRRPDVVDRVLSLQPGLGSAGMGQGAPTIPKAWLGGLCATRAGTAVEGPRRDVPARCPGRRHGRHRGPCGGQPLHANHAGRGRVRGRGRFRATADVDRSAAAIVYLFGWALFYAAFWWIRRPRGRPWEPL